MAAKFSAGEPPDLFYVDSSVAPDWIDQGVLQDLDPLAAERGFDTSQFFPGYLDAFKGPDGKVYGFPKDGNTLAMAYNTDMLTAAGIEPPTNWDELKTAAEKLTTGGKKAFCLNNSLDRALAFIYQNGGSLLSDDKTQNTFDSPEVREALKTYLGFFKNGQGARAADLGDDWCGKALGEQQVAIIFEGGWLDPYMKTSYPDVKYAWAEMPMGTEKATLGFTVSYSIGVDFGEQGRRVGAPDLPDRQGRHDDLDRGWRRQSVPQGRAAGRGQGHPRRGRGVCPAVELHPRLQQDQRRVQQRDDRPDRSEERRSGTGRRGDVVGDRRGAGTVA